MPGELALPSLEIHNFRGLRELKIERLGRANLIVGKNNTGKSSVLEALRIYASLVPSTGILEVLRSRDELYPVAESRSGPLLDRFLPVRPLFHGRVISPETASDDIRVGPVASPDHTLRIRMTLHQDSPPNFDADQESNAIAHLGLLFEFGRKRRSIPIDDSAEFARLDSAWRNTAHAGLGNAMHYVYIESRGLDSEEIQRNWKDIALSDREEQLVESLRLIEPSIERISLVPASEARRDLLPFVRLRGLGDPIYLGSLGEGVNRLFHLALGLTNSADGILLVDEIETGLHYSVQADVWRFIFRVASQLNVQVFATTHSSDCVKAFERAAIENDEEEGVLIHLGREGDRIVATGFDEDALEVAARLDLELRG